MCFVRASDVSFTHLHLYGRATTSSALIRRCFRDGPFDYLLRGAHLTYADLRETKLHFLVLRVFALQVAYFLPFTRWYCDDPYQGAHAPTSPNWGVRLNVLSDDVASHCDGTCVALHF